MVLEEGRKKGEKEEDRVRKNERKKQFTMDISKFQWVNTGEI